MMFSQWLTKIIGSRNERFIKKLRKRVSAINALEPVIQGLTDTELKEKTNYFKQRLAEQATLDDLLEEAFAVIREVARRTLSMRHFDVQLVGGIALHMGKIAEMRTGEGKTLSATLPVYLNALMGKGVHVVTVNDYLAKRDAAWMKPIYEFLGMSVGVILAGQTQAEKRAAYACDIVYGTNNEYGFDYLRDNMAFSIEDRVQRDLYFAVVDEVDSILIDEARTPLIISGTAEDGSFLYKTLNQIVPQLKRQPQENEPGDYFVDEKTRQVFFTEEGHQHLEALLTKANILKHPNLYDVSNLSVLHHVNTALRAHACFQRDVDYIVKNDEVVIVDEHTGRTMPGRRWSDGLHQAIEAKEGVFIQSENITLASITFQNFFRLYQKLSGMTGTADTEAYEFQHIYGLEVVVIPTHQPMIRQDLADQVYLSLDAKYQAILADVKERRAKHQPILVGTASVEASEQLSSLLKKEHIPHHVLNAKFHEKEAQIIAEAGRPGAVTIATNMAGRGTDIILGGNVNLEIASLSESEKEKIDLLKSEWKKNHDQVIAAGGLHIIGSERHESRRIDNQLRGRSGRQGDPGSSRFYLSLQDSLMRIFASDRLAPLMQRFGMQKSEAIEHPWLNKVIENAQRKVEGHNFDIRKQLLEFDDVANEQRKVIYGQRSTLMAVNDISENIRTLQAQVMQRMIDEFVPPQSLAEQWNIVGLEQKLSTHFDVSIALQTWLNEDDSRHEENLRYFILEKINLHFQEKENQFGSEIFRKIEKSVMLQSLDYHWREHLAAMDHLRQGIHLRGYAQRNPKQEYKREAFIMFSAMLEHIEQSVIETLSKLQLSLDAPLMEEERRRASTFKMQYEHNASPVDKSMLNDDISLSAQPQVKIPAVRQHPKIGRNESCYCGSGKKFKHCHGKV